MSLSGTLEIFPLEEVLRLLARSRQNGCLRVEGAGAGKIYMDSGALTYATVEPEEALRSHLLAAGVATEEGLSRLDVSRGNLTEALSPSAAASSLTELIREQCIESLYRIRRPGAGHFEFVVDSQPRYPTGQAFDIETIISESERRASEWSDIETVVPDLSSSWHMVSEIDEESVNLSDTAWRFLAAMEGSCSVEELATRLGITTFQTARRMAELSRARLVEPVAVSSPPAYSQPQYQEPAREESAPATDEQRSWWLEETPGTEAVTEAEPQTEPEPHTEEPTVEPERRDESFLETVFGELEKTEEPESEEDDSDDEGDDDDDEGDGGFGMLRRRGLGAAFRELADS